MYDDIIDLAMDQQLLTEINNQIDYRALPIWRELQLRTDEEIKTLEQKLNNNERLAFDHLFREPIGFYFIKSYLQTQHSVDKAVFIRDVAVYKTLIHPEARKEALVKIFEAFCGPELPDRIQGTSALIDIHASGHLKSATQSVDGTSRSRWSTNDDATQQFGNDTNNEHVDKEYDDDDEQEYDNDESGTITKLSAMNDASKFNNVSENLPHIEEQQQQEQKEDQHLSQEAEENENENELELAQPTPAVTNFVPSSHNTNISEKPSTNNNITNDDDNNTQLEINIPPSNEEIEQQTNTQIAINAAIPQNPMNSENINVNADQSLSVSKTVAKSCSPNRSVNAATTSSVTRTNSNKSNTESVSMASPFFSENSNAIGILENH
eukprot:CAMPEP_0201592598 /NCGR_PEP_ID=MMETSP0190_2-20130828/190453_1 /ASSEMBLY_ACC=CAM_ASM_000263 /TAXON_ID=37353 /ORGANISM="Rosalina sp." /LENGTH=379 /DNA_ID=CAMNT_0048051449 /DNA_START=68 /DNA_END=1208 /DNA_ORIENTATION=+